MKFLVLGCWDNEGDKEDNNVHPEHLLKLEGGGKPEGAKNICTDCIRPICATYLNPRQSVCPASPGSTFCLLEGMFGDGPLM